MYYNKRHSEKPEFSKLAVVEICECANICPQIGQRSFPKSCCHASLCVQTSTGFQEVTLMWVRSWVKDSSEKLMTEFIKAQ